MESVRIQNRHAQYFKILKFQNQYFMYYNDVVHWKTYVRISRDGINFSCAQEILSGSNACHNFAPFVMNGKVYAIGGQDDWKSRIDKKKIKIHNQGLYLFSSENGIDFIEQKLILTAKKEGFTSSLEWKSAEFDSYIGLTKFQNEYYLFLRANISPRKRFIQFSKSHDLVDWIPFQTMNIEDRKEGNYYFACVETMENKMVAFLPFFTEKEAMIDVYTSMDGKKWGYKKSILRTTPVMIKDRNKKKRGLLVDLVPKSRIHPIGIVDDYFYFHDNYRGYSKADVAVKRISLKDIIE